jgi:hypothetical protein
VPDISIPPSHLTAAAVFDRLRRIHADVAFEVEDEGKTRDWMPAWYAHLPSGEKVRIRWIGRKGPLVHFTTPEGSRIILAPDAVVVTIEPLPADTEGFPVEFLDADAEDR